MPLMTLLEWWNLIYILPFGLALMYLGVFVFTGITFGDADVDADMDAGGADGGGEVHVEAHVVDGDSVHGEVHAEHDVSHEASGENDNEGGGRALTPMHAGGAQASTDAGAHSGSMIGDFLTFLGVGKIPLSLALMILLLFWGGIGFGINVMLMRWLGVSGLVGLISVPLTGIASVGLTGAIAALIAKAIPVADSRGQHREDLVGKCGDAIYDIDSTFGMASVRSASGDLFQVPCQTADGARIPKGSRVVLFDYDREKGVFRVAPFAA